MSEQDISFLTFNLQIFFVLKVLNTLLFKKEHLRVDLSPMQTLFYSLGSSQQLFIRQDGSSWVEPVLSSG